MVRQTSSNLSMKGYAEDVNLTAGQNYTTAGQSIPTDGIDEVIIFAKGQGANASSSGTVTIYIAYSYDYEDGSGTFTTEMDAIPLTLSANNPVRCKPWLLACKGCKAIRIARMTNGDATYGVNAVNAQFVSQG